MSVDANKKDISVGEGTSIVTEAATWKGTPYALNGQLSTKGAGGDCSGSTQKIYLAAKCPYDYQSSICFPEYAINSGLFRELGSDEKKQEGDILSWHDHMAIYSSFALDPSNATTERTNAAGHKWTQINDMWTATKPGGLPYLANAMLWFKPGPPRVFRYVK